MDWWLVADFLIFPAWLVCIVALFWLVVSLLERIVANDPENLRRWREVRRREQALAERSTEHTAKSR
jgi:hypothetical protein